MGVVMSPIDRIRRKREMVELSRELDAPEPVIASFPRNAIGVTLLVLVIMPLLFKATIDPTLTRILGYGGCAFGMGAGAASLSYGQWLKSIYDAKHVARAPVVPFKGLGAVLIAVSAGALCWFEGGGLAVSIALIPVVLGLTVLSFGLDPRRHKGLETRESREAYQLEKVAARVGVELDRIKRSAAPLAVPEIMTEIRNLENAIHGLLSAVTNDPTRIGTVRRFFGVYLTAFGDASEQFSSVYSGTGDQAALDNYQQMMTTLTHAYRTTARRYAQAGTAQLEVEMKVLARYLKPFQSVQVGDQDSQAI